MASHTRRQRTEEIRLALLAYSSVQLKSAIHMLTRSTDQQAFEVLLRQEELPS